MSELGEGIYQRCKTNHIRVVRVKHVTVRQVSISRLIMRKYQSCESKHVQIRRVNMSELRLGQSQGIFQLTITVYSI